MRCRDEDVIPSSLKVKPLVKTGEGHRIAERASRSFLSARIRQTYRIKERLKEESEHMKEDLSAKLSGDELFLCARKA